MRAPPSQRCSRPHATAPAAAHTCVLVAGGRPHLPRCAHPHAHPTLPFTNTVTSVHTVAVAGGDGGAVTDTTTSTNAAAVVATAATATNMNTPQPLVRWLALHRPRSMRAMRPATMWRLALRLATAWHVMQVLMMMLSLLPQPPLLISLIVVLLQKCTLLLQI